MAGMQDSDRPAGRISFAAGLQPLAVDHEHGSLGLFRTCALVAATPHTAVNRKFVTDRCKSHIIPRPSSCWSAGLPSAAAQGGDGASQHSRGASPSPPQHTAAAIIAAASHTSGLSAGPGGTAALPSASRSAVATGSSSCSMPPAVNPAALHFEGFWQQRGAKGSTYKHIVHVSFHTDTSPAAFFVRGQLPHTTAPASSSGHSISSSGSSRASRSAHTSSNSSKTCSSCESAATASSSTASDHSRDAHMRKLAAAGRHVLPLQGAWMCVMGASGEPLHQWDLHVGAQLDLLGRKVVLKRASCATMAWLDGWAKLLLQQKHVLEQHLAKFCRVIPDQGLVKHSPERSDWSSPGLAAPAPTGGTVNLRHLRESIALLAARLRQHTAAVRLPRELQDLAPQGPTNWSLDDVLSVLHEAPFTPSAKHASKGQLLRREFSRHGRRPSSLGSSPAGSPPPPSVASLMTWLHSIPLAVSAAATGVRPRAL